GDFGIIARELPAHHHRVVVFCVVLQFCHGEIVRKTRLMRKRKLGAQAPNWRRSWSTCLYVDTRHSAPVSGPKKACTRRSQPFSPPAWSARIRAFTLSRHASSAGSSCTMKSAPVELFFPNGFAPRNCFLKIQLSNLPASSCFEGRRPVGISSVRAVCSNICAADIFPHCRTDPA